MRANVLGICSAVLLFAGSAGEPAEAQSADGNTGSIGTLSGMPTPQADGPQQGSTSLARIPTSSMQAEQGKPVAYHDRERGFIFVAPPGARFQERADGKQIAIQSRKGYAVNIQAGDANPAMGTHHMFAKMEAKYLGDGKPWNAKTAESETVIAGLPAGVAVYEAGSTRSEVVIARGQKTDFVIIFFAPINHFEKLRSEFEWILASFRPAAAELPKEPVRMSKAEEAEPEPPLRAQPAPDPNPAGRPAKAPEPAAPDVQVFAEQGYGYRVEYPTAWRLEKVSAFTNVISGPQGTPAYDAIVALQNVKPDAAANEVARVAYDELKTMLNDGAKGVEFVGEKPVTDRKSVV